MESNQYRAVCGEPIEKLAPRRYRLVGHVVGRRLPFRVLKRDERVGEGVASNDQAVIAGEFKRNVALCVAGRIGNTQASNDLVASFDHFHLCP